MGAQRRQRRQGRARTGVTIPIKDIADPTQPIIDNLTIPPGGLRVSHVAVRDPRPWEENVWLCRVNLEDYYFAALV
jgi:hypothetical protein